MDWRFHEGPPAPGSGRPAGVSGGVKPALNLPPSSNWPDLWQLEHSRRVPSGRPGLLDPPWSTARRPPLGRNEWNRFYLGNFLVSS